MAEIKTLILETSIFNGTIGGGSSVQAIYYKKFLIKNGYDVTLFMGDKGETGLQRTIKVIRAVRKTDLIVGFGTTFLGICLQWLAFFNRKKGVFCIDTVIIPEKIFSDYLRHRVYSPSVMVWCLLESLIHWILFFLPVPHNLINITTCEYLAKKLKKWPLVPMGKSYLYPQLAITKCRLKKNSTNTIVFYGALYRGRGVLDLVRACRLLWAKGHTFKLLIIGYPVYPLTKKALFRMIGREDERRIVVMEKVFCPEKFIRSATVVVIPFRFPCSYQPPLTILEPIALGVPVITTNVGANGEWIKNKQTGLICKPEDPADIASKIEKVFSDQELVAKICSGARKLLNERYYGENLLLKYL